VSKVAPALEVGQRVLYLGDWDWCGHQIEAATKGTLIEHAPLWGAALRAGDWERVALTDEQVEEHDLPVISKPTGATGRGGTSMRWRPRRWVRRSSWPRSAPASMS